MCRFQSSDELAYILGVMKGDGSAYAIQEQKIIQLEAKERAFVESFNNELAQLLHSRPMAIEYLPLHHTYRIRKTSKVFFDWYVSRTRSEIEAIAMNYPLPFIRGFYESEGSVGRYGKNGKCSFLRIMNTDPSLIYLVSAIMNQLSFRHTVKKTNRPNHRTLHWIRMYERGNILSFLETIRPAIKNTLLLKGAALRSGP